MTVTTEMGTYGLPGTFPTSQLVDELNKFDPLIKQGKRTPWSRDAVNSLYFHYKGGVESGEILSLDKGDHEEIVSFIQKHSGLKDQWIEQFVTVLNWMGTKGMIPPIYIEVIRPAGDPIETGTDKLKEVGKGVGDFTMKYLNTFKWLGIAAITGAGLYFGYPIYKSMTSKGKK